MITATTFLIVGENPNPLVVCIKLDNSLVSLSSINVFLSFNILSNSYVKSKNLLAPSN